MDRKGNLPNPTAPLNPSRSVAVTASAASDANLTSSSSSSSSATFSPPDFLRQAHAVFKRHRPLGTMQSNICRATRVLVSQTEPTRSSTSLPAVSGNQAEKNVARQAGAAATMTNVSLEQRKDIVTEIVMNPLEDSSTTLPSVSGTLTATVDEKVSLVRMQKDAELLPDGQGKPSAVVSSFQVGASRANADNNLKKANLTLQNGESYLGTLAPTAQNFEQQDIAKLKLSRTKLKFEETNLLDNRKDTVEYQQYVSAVTGASVMGSSCATMLSVYSGPTLQCTHAPPPGQTAFTTQMSSSAIDKSIISDYSHPEVNGSALKESDGHQNHQHDKHLAEKKKDININDGDGSLPSKCVSENNNPPSTRDLGHSHQSKVEKAPRKKKYDPDVFFKVNGKLYQKLGKIGSGGSSEVHKVISSDCTIYALKKIKLKGRDYPTAYGFCQEIEYLNKLKGKSNIIQLIDYEVTDKTLLREVVCGSMTLKDKRIKDDECIYMVLEYGEIDLAHMLSQKWKEISSSNSHIDENWLRFYWQQMLEAVNTIHEERIVHSDLKPANFLLVRGSLKLIDFGIAKAIMSDTTNIQRDAQVGTLNYMSPEAFMCNEDDANGNTIKCGRPSDIWSLGCILYQMVYGKTPFAEYKTFWAKFKVVTDRNHKIAYDPVPNPWLIDLMRKCLAWDRNERWRIPQLLQHPFLIPPVPREIPRFCEDRPWKLLVERVGAHRNQPEVSKILSKLTDVIAKLDNVDPTHPNVS